jgi:hypothetical protein
VGRPRRPGGRRRARGLPRAACLPGGRAPRGRHRGVDRGGLARGAQHGGARLHHRPGRGGPCGAGNGRGDPRRAADALAGLAHRLGARRRWRRSCPGPTAPSPASAWACSSAAPTWS